MPTFLIPDMTCGHCASTIARALASVDKNARIEVSIPQKLVTVASTAPEVELAEAIREAGYSPEKIAAAAPLAAPAAGGCCCRGAKAAAVEASASRRTAGDSCCS